MEKIMVTPIAQKLPLQFCRIFFPEQLFQSDKITFPQPGQNEDKYLRIVDYTKTVA